MPKKVFKIYGVMSKMYLNEIEQDVNIKFAWGKQTEDGTIQLCHPFVRCRDYLQDAIWMVRYNKNSKEDTYGFTYNPYDWPRITTHPNIYMAVKTTKTKALPISKKLLNFFEKEEGLPLTKLYTTDKPGIFLFKSPSDWVESTFTVSMYSYLIRCGLQVQGNFQTKEELIKEIKTQTTGNDQNYARTTADKLFKIFHHRKEIGFSSVNISHWGNYTVHNSGGIQALCNFYLENGELKRKAKAIL